jgi:glycosyltransferase involved in cell wall biosynthesis
MRILMVCPSYPPQDVTCGVGDYTRCLAEELASQGEDVVAVTSDRYRGSTEGHVRIVPTFRRWSWDAAMRLVKLSTSPHADVIHFQYTPELYGRGIGMVLAPLLLRMQARQTAVVVTFHTLIGGGFRSKLVAPYLLATAHHSISANEEVTALIRRHLPRLARRMTEIPIGANIPTVAAAFSNRKEENRRVLGMPNASPLLVYFGLVYPGKGLETLFEALRHVLSAYSHATLMIIGNVRPQDQAYRAHLEQLSRDLGVDASIRWMEYQPADAVARLLQAADLFVVPYDQGVSIRRSSLMAGLAQGLPVVSTHPAVPSAYLRDGDNISLVPSRNSHALAERIVSLLTQPDDAIRMGKAAAALAERFTWPVIARETRDLYARLLRR